MSTTESLFNEPGGITESELLAMWNDAAHAHGMDGARAINSTRRRRIAKLIRDYPSRDYWREVIDRIAASGFCTGKIAGYNGRTWRADFDFLTRYETHLKALEGKYDDDKFSTTGPERANGRARVYRDAGDVQPMRMITGGH
jgi:hypothetical protein